ncbi:hypothetical protein QJQ45_021762 [Haematococcus lacustris]|nr:hypothetical protein QJQ45_021762 [Haematococcus lacustris]
MLASHTQIEEWPQALGLNLLPDSSRLESEAAAKAMNEIWGFGDHIQVIHPLASTIAGREAVMDSWRSILKGVRPRAFNITLEDVRIYADEAHAFVTCVEVINADDSQGRITATNIFEKQDGKWKITLHHGSEAPLRKKPSPFAT